MAASTASKLDAIGIRAALDAFPNLKLRPRGDDLCLEGEIQFSSRGLDGFEISGSYSVAITIPDRFPKEIPAVRETGQRIPKTFHTNPDGTLCLGAPFRLRLLLKKRPNVLGFVETCLIPFLYGHSYSVRFGRLPFGELAHGEKGLVEDFLSFVGTKDRTWCAVLLRLAGEKRRIANKRVCPCGSGRRVGRCHNGPVNRLRRKAPRSFLRAAAIQVAG